MPTFQTTDGLTLYYEDDGKGASVLCLAGLTRNSRDFDFVAPHLAHKRLIRMDYRGRGKSDYDPDFMNYSIMREAQDAIELLDHLGLEKVTLLGTSRGGLIAMVLAYAHKSRLNGVILNDIGPVVDAGGLERIMDYVGKEPNFATYAAAAEGLAAVYGDDFPGVIYNRWLVQAEFMWAEQGKETLALRYDARLRDALVGQAGAGDAPDLWSLFAALEGLPLASVRGANSDLLTAETQAEMARRHPGMIAATVPDRGHVPFLDEPEALKAIADLLEQVK
ncbi:MULTISPECIES: alpha/beta fold hydrolase [unclassified Roseovarius]|uniref:alpha/beta fold hydrolase n=1 Tax=unclassified Roseovarius TaxID=2614913 RepID=UPI00273D2CDC|nr:MULTISPECIES: alpha/beta hydrolase [unclassified Roseovarius]